MNQSIKIFFCAFLGMVILFADSLPGRADPIIIDHNCTDIAEIPASWIGRAREELKIAYGHTSHGSQVISGMEVLRQQSALYAFSHDGGGAVLSLHDGEPAGDLGNPDRTEWYHRTRALLDQPGNTRNMVVWAWCGQVSSATAADIETYLGLMSQLERDYPQVIFVYMTGHLDGSGENGNLHLRNNQIRRYCHDHDKVLFDFADIESYDPDGNYFLNKEADDGCNYREEGVSRNWAEEWCARNPGICCSCSCAHSHALNCELKGKAFWWLLARVAGWNSTGAAPENPSPASTDGNGGGGCFLDTAASCN